MTANWKIVPLGEIAEVKLGKMLDKAKHQTGRKFPYLRNINVRWGAVETDDVFEMHFEDDQVERFSLRAGDVLVCEGGEPGRAAVWNGHVAEMKFQKAIHRVRFNVPFEARLLVYLLESLAKSGGLERRFTGSTIKHFTREAFVQLPIPFPPEDEQRRIVAEIEKQFTRLEAGVAALRRVQANLKRYRAAVLKAACEGDWPQRPLGEIAEVRLGKMLDKTKHVSGRKLPYLRNVNVRWGKTETDDLREMYFEEDQLERYGLKAGDVLVCEGGEPGRAAVWSGHLPEMKYQKAIHRVRFNIPFDPRLLVWLLERLALTGGLERRFTGSTIKHFTREAFVELPIPVPPLAEQTRIVAEVERRLSVVEELESVVTANLQRATRLRQSILQRAFSGQLVRQETVARPNEKALAKSARSRHIAAGPE
ncbi:MAG: restriction endonuclease subunit S [Verrucomicrobia bacterium]|nr:restriction endonuclease subunit S [Verrucomicrobiota bacterium]